MENNTNTYFVYQHKNLLNNKRYIGLTKRLPKIRWGSNGCNYKNTPRFWSAIKKYGWDGFSHEILYSGLTKEEACSLEIKLIHEYDTTNKNFGYNITEGGDAPSPSQETREKISKSLIGNKFCLGKPCSEETKKKIRDAQKGRKFTEEHKKKISEAKRGKKQKPCPEETKKKISDSHKKKPVYCVELNKTFPSIQECARELNILATYICACCKGRIRSIYNLHFSYAENVA